MANGDVVQVPGADAETQFSQEVLLRRDHILK